MLLNANLLDSSRGLLTGPDDLYAVLNAHGLYNSTHFVLRLSPEVHRKLSGFSDGVKIRTGVDFEGAQAMSTYLHETIHWWQHIGTTTGLMLSLVYPAQAHANHNHLLRLLADIGPKKSLRQFSGQMSSNSEHDTTAKLATAVVNNQCDLAFFRALVTKPKTTQLIVEDQYFNCIGHAYNIAYSKIIFTLASTFDQDFRFLPDPRSWDTTFTALRVAKVKGFFRGSDVSVPPVGAYEIFEGQARFAQLQYLHFASGGRLSWDDVRALGMLEGVYGAAFEHFLRFTELNWPVSINSPVVGLFLLVCDVACNPGEGFPLPLLTPNTFIDDIDPGMRFIFLCRAVPMFCQDVAGTIKSYSRDEYIEVSERLATALRLFSPLTVCAELVRWAREGENFRALVDRHRSFACADINVPIQVLLGHSIAFAEDKLARPEFFCWPGAWMAGDRCTPDVGDIFARNAARFTDKAGDETIFPVIPPGANEATIVKTFEKFYASHVVYELTRQWIAVPGPFRYDYRWLQPAGTDGEIKAWADRNFRNAFGVHPDEFEVL